jgi:hypothetical protein
MSNGASEIRRPSSPVLNGDGSPTFSPPAFSPAQTNANSLLAVARRVDSGATISAVTKTNDSSTLIKIDPSEDAGTTKTLATLAALRVGFPFATVSALESHTTGHTQFHVILRTNTEEVKHAKEMYKDLVSMKVLKSISNALAVFGLCAYAALLYATAIRP